MSGNGVGRALRRRFDVICRSELGRLDKKFRSLSDADRQCIESVVTEIVATLAGLPESTLAQDPPVESLHAVVRLFDLSWDSSPD